MRVLSQDETLDLQYIFNPVPKVKCCEGRKFAIVQICLCLNLVCKLTGIMGILIHLGIDTRIKFSFIPQSGKKGFRQVRQ